MEQDTFVGTKLLLFLGHELLVIRRDHTPGIPFPGFLDFPGGGREGTESAQDCVRRETFEEVGLRVSRRDLIWTHPYDAPSGARSWFFAAHLPAGVKDEVQFGNEGFGWSLIAPETYIGRPDAIPHFQTLLGLYLREITTGRHQI